MLAVVVTVLVYNYRFQKYDNTLSTSLTHYPIAWTDVQRSEPELSSFFTVHSTMHDLRFNIKDAGG